MTITLFITIAVFARVLFTLVGLTYLILSDTEETRADGIPYAVAFICFLLPEYIAAICLGNLIKQITHSRKW